MSALLKPGVFVDSDHPSIVAFARDVAGDATSDGLKVERLFRAVREKIRYDPYAITFDPLDYRASAILDKPRAYCIPKAVLLAASARAAGIPARLGFADVKNHLSSQKLLDTLGTDLFAFHGFVEVWVDGAVYKLTPAFNASLCARFRVPTLDFDARSPADAMLQPFDSAGNKYMEYLADRGSHFDLPFEAIMATFRELYPALKAMGPGSEREHDGAFHD